MQVIPRIRTALAGLGRPYEMLRQLARDRQIYLTGGAIRDIILGRNPCDFDFAVSGSGIALARALARHTHGSFVMLSEVENQVRVAYPTGITIDITGFGSARIREELARRDFTANAIAWRIPDIGNESHCARLLDPFDGRKAIAERKLAPVSVHSLELDPLRLLRAFRIAAVLDFTLDDDIFRLARGLSLSGIAPERIGYEMMRLMSCDNSYRHIRHLYDLGFLHQIMPEARPLFDYQMVIQHSLRTYRKLEQLIHRDSYFRNFPVELSKYFSANPDRIALLKLAGLLHDIAKPETEFINDRNEVHFYGHDSLGARTAEIVARRRLRLSRANVRIVKQLVEYHMRLHLLATGPELTDRAIRRFFRDLGDEYFGLMMLTFADGHATAGFTRHLEEKFAQIIRLKRQWDAAVKVARLITGEDLIQLGMKPGPEFKVILAELEELQIEGKLTNKEQGIAYIKQKVLAGK